MSGIILLLLLLLFCIIVNAQIKVTRDVSGFGYDTAVYGDYSIVGSYMENNYTGAAYIYYYNDSGVYEAVQLNGTHDHDFFGASVAIWGDYAMISASGYEYDDGHGVIFVYHRNSSGWYEESIIKNAPFTLSTIDLYDDYAIIRAYSNRSNVAMIYHRNDKEWLHQQTLSSNEKDDRYGDALAISNHYAIVGANYAGYNAYGLAYIYHYNTTEWVQEAVLIPTPYQMPKDRFGYAVDIYDTTAIVGMFRYYFPGVVHVYERNETGSWLEIAQLSDNDGAIRDRYGSHLSIVENYILIGSWGKNKNRGEAFIYHRTVNHEWQLIQQLKLEDGIGAYSVQLSTNYALVTKPGAAIYYINKCHSGASLNYDITCTPCEPGSYEAYEYAISCTPCTVGSYCATSGLLQPTNNCNSGSYCPIGSSVDDKCPAGSYCTNPSTLQTCPLGSFCPSGSITPTVCTIGSYCPSNSSSSDQCPAGSYCTNPSTLQTCPLGSFCPSGSITPTVCTIGSYCPEGSSSNYSCPTGSYCINPSTIQLCPAGSYCSEGSTNPNTPCPQSYYCTKGISTPISCPSGYYCPKSSAAPSKCSSECPADKPLLVSTCSSSNNIVCSTSVIVDTRSFSAPWILLGVFIGFILLLLIFLKIVATKYPHSKPYRLFVFIFTVIDCISDIAFMLHVHNIYNKAFIASLLVFVLTIFPQGAFMTYFISSHWMSKIEFQKFVGERTFWFGLVFLISSTNIESILFLSSKCFALDMLSAPLSHDDELLVESISIIIITFTTIPQLIIQLLVALDQKELSGPIGFALLITIIQLFICIIKLTRKGYQYWKKRKQNNIEECINHTNTEYTELVDSNNYDEFKHLVSKEDIKSYRLQLELELNHLKELQQSNL